MSKIQLLTADDRDAFLPDLISLLQNCVNSGASVGFIPPLSKAFAEEYWKAVFEGIASGHQLLVVAIRDQRVVGSVQLALATKQNAAHRAEVQKLLVHTGNRRFGIAKDLLSELEIIARNAGRTLLVLDTEQASAAENLYRKCGYTESGVIPNFALNADGVLISTVVFYKLLSTPAQND
ncbi:MAG TPA: GNAT family N-acetyltransferase [Pyrinomonadaceae bacterium]|nr:GNAT family N-acetyltransferase [Pyrinomonadaceae bacterium]